MCKYLNITFLRWAVLSREVSEVTNKMSVMLMQCGFKTFASGCREIVNMFTLNRIKTDFNAFC